MAVFLHADDETARAAVGAQHRAEAGHRASRNVRQQLLQQRFEFERILVADRVTYRDAQFGIVPAVPCDVTGEFR